LPELLERDSVGTHWTTWKGEELITVVPEKTIT